MEKNNINYLKFMEECRTYKYEKEALKQLEKRLIHFNKSCEHYENVHRSMDPIRRYRLLETHIKHVDNVFRDLERTYGTKIAKTIRNQVVSLTSSNDIDDAYQNCISYVLNKQQGGQYEKYHS